QYQQPAYDPADDEEDPKDAHGKKDAHGGGHGEKGDKAEKKDAGHGEAKKDEHKPAKPSAAH
ncbi:MAG: hypothetical protein NTW74_07565, partial [Acidobacteria bacterium]|nr:hypothetical protein [Acidobacteriota bacterium]